ncbi:hypothetical protein [Aerococcus urinae]|uniref:baeRF3 domain-containing protein n=1 Tax=Aerococcus urinae TaxID=1376 RepID=UPI0018A6FF7F|nr:hypothetical protein [Aerococcus urinae]
MTVDKRLYRVVKANAEKGSPKISLYMPTHRAAPENQQDPIRYENLLNEVKTQLETNYPDGDWQRTFDHLAKLIDEKVDFWQKNKEGLVILASDQLIEIFRLRQEQEEIAYVGDYFHLVPLLAYYEEAFDVILADIAKDQVQLYLADQYSYEPTEIDEIKSSFYDIYDDNDSENKQTTSRGQGSIHSNQSKSVQVERDRDKYFSYLDQEFDKLAKEVERKILLAGTKENIAAFKKESSSKVYLDTAIEQPISGENHQRIKELLAETLSPLAKDNVKAIEDNIEEARGASLLMEEVEDIQLAAKEGRIAELVIFYGESSTYASLIDELIHQTIINGGEISVVPASSVTETSTYALLRY